MRIGIDFDNTIVSYDALFHKVAREQGVIPAHLAPTKLAVRDYLRRQDRENVWTEMQGYVYGARMDEAAAYPGVVEFLRWARGDGVALSIISHKTRHPFIGPQYDLHEAARRWVESHLNDGGRPLVEPPAVFFELTKEEKIACIGTVGCDYYIDDLPEILLAPEFPAATRRILFDPDAHHGETGSLPRMSSWSEILANIQQACRTLR
jgi:hypothetical protein